MKLNQVMERSVNSAVKLESRVLGNRRALVNKRGFTLLGITVFLVAVIFRGAVGWSMIGNLDADPDAYAEIARAIQSHGVYGLVDDRGIARPTAFRPPLYPWLLSRLSIGDPGNRSTVLIAHALLGGWSVFATFLISRRYVSIPMAVLAAGLVAVDPILVMQSTLVMTETLATALSASVLWWCSGFDETKVDQTSRPSLVFRSALLGTLLALSFLCRPTFLVWAALLVFAWVAVWLWRDRGANWRSNLLTPAIVVLMVAAAVGAWTLRNWKAIGYPVWATTHGGYTLLLANNPSFYNYLRSAKFGEVWDAEPFLQDYQDRKRDDARSKNRGSEHSDDRWAYDAAKKTIAEQPQMFAYSCLVRVGRLWSPMPHQVAGRSAAVNFGVGAFYLTIFLLAVIGCFKLRRCRFDRFLLAALTLAMTLTLVHSIYWTNMRMRAPLTPALAVLAVVGCFGTCRLNEIE